MQPPPQPLSSSSQQGSKIVVIVAIVVGALLAVVAVVGILAAVGIRGMRTYLAKAKESEGRQVAAAIARGVIACSEKEAVAGGTKASGLPPSTTAVPAALDAIAGKKYQSSRSEWSTAPWDCIGFSMNDPQYFQYQWVRTSDTEGTVRAASDLDGDRTVDVTFEVPVTCTTSPLSCRAGTILERR